MLKLAYKNLVALAALAATSVSCFANVQDATILIDRALNGQALTIKYTGAHVALVELRVNGSSVATRSANQREASGETNFTLDLNALRDGDNRVEIRLFDALGKLVGVQRTTVHAERGPEGPVSVTWPKAGATVQGPVEIKVSIKASLKNAYVSFFINDEFKSLKNFPPYSYVWDTAAAPNGWHDLEAWVVDETNATFKSRKVRVFVNNPSGRTERPTIQEASISGSVGALSTSKTSVPVVAEPSKLKPLSHGAAIAFVNSSGAVAPKLAGILSPNKIAASTAPMAGTKPARISASVATGPKLLTPTGTRNVAENSVSTPKTGPKITVAPNLGKAPLVSIEYGSRLPDAGRFTIYLDRNELTFDVAPRVQDGIPLTPFRHLFEHAGGSVKWEHLGKNVRASGKGQVIFLHIGNATALVNDKPLLLELAPFIENSRTVVPLSFIHDSLHVNVQYDPNTGHVLISSSSK